MQKVWFSVGKQSERSVILAVGLDCTVNGTLGVAQSGVGALVVELLAFAKPQFHLHTAMLEIERKRNQRIAGALRHRSLLA